jgi:protein-tyrosine phosphatase
MKENGLFPTIDILVVCTGNAARSVMMGTMLERVAATSDPRIRVTTAGTHAINGQPMSMRTRAAIESIDGLAGVHLGRHRSRQLRDEDMVSADLVVTMEADHVRYIRRHHPEAADRTATLKRFARSLHAGPEPLSTRVAQLSLADVELDDEEDVDDPAGREDAIYVTCAQEIWALTETLVATF